MTDRRFNYLSVHADLTTIALATRILGQAMVYLISLIGISRLYIPADAFGLLIHKASMNEQATWAYHAL